MARKSDAQILKEETPVTVAPTEAPEAETPVNGDPIEAPETETPVNTAPTKEPAPLKERVVPNVAPTAPKVKKVRVILTQDINSFINGVRYEYPAKKMIEVPEDVAQILVHGNKGYRM